MRDGSAVKSSCCYGKGPLCTSQHRTVVHNHPELQTGDLIPVSAFGEH